MLFSQVFCPRQMTLMSKQKSDPEPALPISAVERETGLSKDVLRKWEVRYRFPLPERDAAGERLYPAEQVAKLRLVKRLLDAGMRPSRIVTQPPDVLADLAERQQPKRQGGKAEAFEEEFLRDLRNHDTPALRQGLSRVLHRDGLHVFVQDKLANLINLVGEAWARGELDIYEEHLFSEVVQGMLRGIVDNLNDAQGRPRILLTTFPGELHGLGLLMVSALATLEGAYCLSLGTQTPAQEIRNAVDGRAIDVVAISLSSTYPARRVTPALEQLREILPESVAVWAGGEGAARSAKPRDGIKLTVSLSDVSAAIADWRLAHLQEPQT